MRDILYALTFVFIVIVIGNIVIVAQTDMKPPVAKKETKVTKIHGYELKDDYFWLRSAKTKRQSAPEVIKYLEAENAYTESFMKPHQAFVDNLYKEMLGRIKQTDLSVPYKSAITGITRKPKKASNIRCISARKSRTATTNNLLLDQNEMAKGLQIFCHRLV